MILSYRWFDIIVLNVHVPTKAKTENAKNGFHLETECAFNTFPKHHVKKFLGHFNAEVNEEAIFKPGILNESLHETSTNNGLIAVNFVTHKRLIIKSTIFPHRSFHKFT
jgi:hypothetical protein